MSSVVVEIWNHTGTKVDVQGLAYDVQWYEEIGGAGSGSFTVTLTDLRPAASVIGNRVKFRVDGTLRGGFVIDKVEVRTISSSEDADRVATVSGRGLLAILDEAKAYNADGALGADKLKERVMNGTPGAIMATLITEAKARGCFPDLTLDFSGTTPTGGGTWPESVSYVITTYTSLLDIATTFRSVGWADVWVTPDGKVRSAPLRGTNKTASVVLWPGRHLASHSITRSGPVRPQLIWAHDNDTGLSENTTASSTYGRREHFAIVPAAADDSTRTAVIATMLELQSTPAESVTAEIVEAADARVWSAWDVGDTIRAPGLNNELVDLRVRALAVNTGPAGELRIVPTLGTQREELEARLREKLDRTQTDYYNPPPTVPADGGPIGDGEFTFPPTDTPDFDPIDFGIQPPSPIWFSTDNGTTWGAGTNPSTSPSLSQVAVSRDGIVLVFEGISGGARVWRSVDNGAVWKAVSTIDTYGSWGSSPNLSYCGALDAFVVWGGSRVSISFDRGTTWQVNNPPFAGEYFDGAFNATANGNPAMAFVSRVNDTQTSLVYSYDGVTWHTTLKDFPAGTVQNYPQGLGMHGDGFIMTSGGYSTSSGTAIWWSPSLVGAWSPVSILSGGNTFGSVAGHIPAIVNVGNTTVVSFSSDTFATGDGSNFTHPATTGAEIACAAPHAVIGIYDGGISRANFGGGDWTACAFPTESGTPHAVASGGGFLWAVGDQAV